MTISLYIAMALTAVSTGVGVAAIVNAVRVNRVKHDKRAAERNMPASFGC